MLLASIFTGAAMAANDSELQGRYAPDGPEHATRAILSERSMVRRVLASSKVSTVTTVNCQGSWSAWSACKSSGVRDATYKVTRYASGGGSSCAVADGASKQEACDFDCEGSWGAWSACNAATGSQSQTYAVKNDAKNG